MQTSCPHCQTVFKVSNENLSIADGYVRCGICKEVFNALEKKEPIAKSEIAIALEKAAGKNSKPSETSPLESATEQNIEQADTKDQNAPTASEDISDQKEDSPITETTDTGGNTQTDLFTTPSETNKTEPASITSEETAVTEPKAAEPGTPKTDSLAAKIEIDANTESTEQTHNDKDVTDSITEQPSTVAEKSITASTTVTPATETKNTTELPNDSEVDSNLFDGVQSKLIPDEYRIPELHNTSLFWQDITWSLAILVLTASLFAEYTWFNRNELITNPQLRPLISQLCIIANCNEMELREPSEIEMTTRNIYTHPNIKNALMVSGTMINHARFEQPYPNILIDFSDVRGKVIASRTFTPDDYLQIKASSLRPLVPEFPIDFNMEIQDPGKQAMTYEFSFL